MKTLYIGFYNLLKAFGQGRDLCASSVSTYVHCIVPYVAYVECFARVQLRQL